MTHARGKRTQEPTITVAVCTRDRPGVLHPTLDALDEQTDDDFDVVVVDQGEQPDGILEGRAGESARLRVDRSGAVGLASARNRVWRSTDTSWIVFVDDDCLLARDWVERLRATIRKHPQCAFVSGHVDPVGSPVRGYPALSCVSVTTERVRRGRWVNPRSIGLGVCMAVQRQAIERLGGWDERLGPGTAFPAADDVEFNHRLLRAGYAACTTPRLRAGHVQWRSALVVLARYREYSLSWAALAMRQLRREGVLTGGWLWAFALQDFVRLFAAGIGARSTVSLRASWVTARWTVVGSWRGLTYAW